ncbi:hypothetical protein ACFFRR_005262 [Megaselia abdita]
MSISEESRLNSGMKCIKYMIFTISFMFAITSILLIMVGSTINNIYGDFSQFIDQKFVSPAELLIAIGFLMLAVSIFGAVGAFKESVACINIFGFFLFLIFILEVGAAIAAFCLPTQTSDMLIRTMNESMLLYEDNQYIREGVDFMQSGLECCGIESQNDWCELQNANNTNPCYMPLSCISYNSNGVLDYYETGCLRRMNFIISQSAMLIAIGATTVAFVQLLGVICSFLLAKTLRRNKSLREVRRNQFQQNLGMLIDSSINGSKSSSNDYSKIAKYQENIETKDVEQAIFQGSPSVN